MDCLPSDRENLQRITAVAHRINALCKADRQQPPRRSNDDAATATTCADVPLLVLPLPKEITQALKTSGCPLMAAQSLSDVFMRSAHQIRDMYESIHRQTSQKIARHLAHDRNDELVSNQLKSLRIFVERQYQDQISATKKLAFDRFKNHQQHPHAVETSRRNVFNQEFVPMLEKYFEYNAYPSSLDRATLARKSRMSPRQIEVWFQNHRNRSKKDGRTLQRLTSDPLLLKLSLESLEQTKRFFPIPDNQQKYPIDTGTIEQESNSNPDEDDRASGNVTDKDTNATFNLTAPSHAFPTTYPPSCNYDPFPSKTGPCVFSSPAWARRPATSLRYTPEIDFDTFIAEFATKLVLGSSSSRNKTLRNATPGVPPVKPSWFAATRTIAPPAPHPAFLRSPLPAPAAPSASIRLPAVPAYPSRPHAFRPPSPHSQPATLVPPAQRRAENSPKHRKVARLPRRTPKNPSITHRGGSPTTSETSPSPSPQWYLSTSRISSLSSEASSDRLPSTSSSSPSSSSSALTTPELPPTSLPEITQPTMSVSEYDFQSLGQIFGDSAMGFMPPTDAFQLNFPSDPIFSDPTLKGKDLFDFEFGTLSAADFELA